MQRRCSRRGDQLWMSRENFDMLNHLEGLRRKSRAGDRSERKTRPTERFGKADFRCGIAKTRPFTLVGLATLWCIEWYMVHNDGVNVGGYCEDGALSADHSEPCWCCQPAGSCWGLRKATDRLPDAQCRVKLLTAFVTTITFYEFLVWKKKKWCSYTV